MPLLRKSSNLSNYFKELRVKRDLSPGGLASLISRNNIPKVGNIIRTFEVQDTDDLDEEDPWTGILAAVSFAVRATFHTTTRATPM